MNEEEQMKLRLEIITIEENEDFKLALKVMNGNALLNLHAEKMELLKQSTEPKQEQPKKVLKSM